jgi:hypothetical protein
MTTKADERIHRLEQVVTRLEALGLSAPVPSPSSVNPDGTPGHVVAGELIESAWGNATSDSISIHRGAITAHTGRLDALEAEDARAHAWVKQVPDSAGPFGTTPADFPGLSVTFPALMGHIYRLSGFVASATRTLAGNAYIQLVNQAGAVYSTGQQTMDDGENESLFVSSYVALVSGSITVKLQLRVGGNGSLQVTGATGYNSFVAVEEVSNANPFP